jgi:hypothetical protein
MTNIPCDLRIEHVNRTGQDELDNVGHQNLTEEQTDRIGRSLLELQIYLIGDNEANL